VVAHLAKTNEILDDVTLRNRLATDIPYEYGTGATPVLHSFTQYKLTFPMDSPGYCLAGNEIGNIMFEEWSKNINSKIK